MRGDFLGEHRNSVEFKVLISGSGCFKERGHNVHNVRFGKRGMQQQVAAIFDIAEIQAQRTSVGDSRTYGFLFVPLECQPYLASSLESYFTVQVVHFGQFWISGELLRGQVNAATRHRSDKG